MDALKRLTEYQQKLILRLLNKYQNSKSFRGTNIVEQSFFCRPQEIFVDYDEDFVNLTQQDEFVNDVQDLESLGLIYVKWDKFHQTIEKIIANPERMTEYPQLVGEKDKRSVLNEMSEILKKYSARSEVLTAICSQQLARIEQSKEQNIVKGGLKDLENVLRCLDFIGNNQTEILERELSIELFGDSKIFEKDYKNKVCSLLFKNGDYDEIIRLEDNSSVRNALILSQHQVVKNPSYFYFKGSGMISFADGTEMQISEKYPIALRSDAINDIQNIDIRNKTVMTIENLTAFNRFYDENVFCLFLSGYNNSCKTRFLQKLHDKVPEKHWLHFGDIDPDGLYILESLKYKTGIQFLPVNMGIEELRKYRNYCKPLEENDIVKARNLIENGLYQELAKYMLDNNCKLEQEIISWKMYDK